jgi:exodeoxyribonuclease V alpha subunit
VSTAGRQPDQNVARLARRAVGHLRDFNQAGILTAADVHVAGRLGRLAAEERAETLLGAALTVRAARLGSVYVDLATVADTVTVEGEDPIDVPDLPWPEPNTWLETLRDSPLVVDGETEPDQRPLRLVGTRLYLDRLWRDERLVAAELIARTKPAPGVDREILKSGLDRFFSNRPDDLQRLAGAVCTLQLTSVVGGGPGTGKTTTVTRILLLLDQQAAAAGQPTPLVALAAPTGKAAARLEEAVRAEALRLQPNPSELARLLDLRASTLHRLLGRRPDSATRFRHDSSNRLPHDVVIVDETSMMSLTLTARLLEAVRADARLILVGDPQQLTSIEAGAVLGDVVGPADQTLTLREPRVEVGPETQPGRSPIRYSAGSGVLENSVVVLRKAHRFGGAIATLADNVRTGDTEAALELLTASHPDVHWIKTGSGENLRPGFIDHLRESALTAGRQIIEAARRGDAQAAIAALSEFRLLCAHRRGPHGVSSWNALVERWLADEWKLFSDDRWYIGRPVLVTHNDYGLRLFNGDTGVVVARPDGARTVAFERQGKLLEVSPNRLDAVETTYALTIHKSQGSQFESAVVLLPGPESRILSRELLYTGVTRARKSLTLYGSEAAIRAALDHPVGRASGLRERIWPPATTAPNEARAST